MKFNSDSHNFTPSPSQREIIYSNEKNISVRAGAGTGKTAVLIRRIVELLRKEFKETNQINLKNFAIVTFTNKAAGEMKKRLQSLLYEEWYKQYNEDGEQFKRWRTQVDIIEMVDIGTIHKFCEKLLRTYGLHINVPVNFKIASVKKILNQKSNEIINKYSHNLGFEDIPLYKISKHLVKFYELNSGKGFFFENKIDDLLKQLDVYEKSDFWKSIKSTFLMAYKELVVEIGTYKQKNNIFTADDLIIYSAKLIENNYAGKLISERYKYIFIDEFQDTNNSQYEMVSSLSDKGVNIFIVGDEKQSIYRFRGADIRSYQKTKESKGYREYDLSGNFRTDKVLLEKINRIFSNISSNINFTPLIPTKDKSESLNCDQFSFYAVDKTSNELPTFIIELLKVLKKKNIQFKVDNNLTRDFQFKDIAVLYRSNYYLDKGVSSVKNEGNIPYQVLGGKGFYKSQEVINTFLILQYLAFREEHLKEMLYFTDFFHSLEMSIERFNQFIDNLEVASRYESVSRLLEIIFNESAIYSYYHEKKHVQAISNLRKLIYLCIEQEKNDFQHLIDYVNYLNIMIVTSQEEEEAEILPGYEMDTGFVTMMSIHKAKGLEFPIVILPHFDKNIMTENKKPTFIYNDDKSLIAFYNSKDPKNKLFNLPEAHQDDSSYSKIFISEEQEMISEEHRILYVALTRAENMVFTMSDTNKKPEHSWAKWVD